MIGVQAAVGKPEPVNRSLSGINLIEPMGPNDLVAGILAERRRLPLARALDRARQMGADVAALQDITANLSQSAFEEVNAHPFFSRWLHRIVAGLMRGGSNLPQNLAMLGNLVLVPALRDGIITSAPLPIDVGAGGTAQLFARHGGGYLTDVAEDAQIEMIDDAIVWRRMSGEHGAVGIQTVLSGEAAPAPSEFRPFTRVAGSGIVLDAFHPWVQAFMDELNHQDAGERTPDLRPVALNDEHRARLADALALIARACPEMRAEIEASVAQIAPFSSSWRRAFTNTSWQGLVFLNADMSDTVAVVDRLIHETSHLRLNAIQTAAPLHTWPRDKTLPSPFRSGPRPVDGVYHGVFVFTRVCRMLRQVASITSDPEFLAPIDDMRAQIQTGLDALGSLGGSTPLGLRLIEELSLAQAHFKHEGDGI